LLIYRSPIIGNYVEIIISNCYLFLLAEKNHTAAVSMLLNEKHSK
jgi:hypothetical protein